mmetsp:Transcript_5870/g.8815  ORF Transcript_5870/g.8815 Transcript_5870/m.8815 type:complete len:151 (-) Transcript_5870:70-522(-)
MATVPDILVWELVKNNSCFLHKRNGKKHRTGTVTLTCEPNNMLCINSKKFSGLANKNAFDIKLSAGKAKEYVFSRKVPQKINMPNRNVKVSNKRKLKVIKASRRDLYQFAKKKMKVLKKLRRKSNPKKFAKKGKKKEKSEAPPKPDMQVD